LTLDRLPRGREALIVDVVGDPSFRRRLLELGFTQGAVILRLGQSPLGDPLTFRIREATVALRVGDAANIIVTQQR
jgi:Fe2+ transport system protein FeoA